MKILRRERRIAVYKRDNGRCVWCGHAFRDVDDPLVTLDHIVPNSKQGSSWWENMLLSCKPCNGRRGDIAAKAFAAQCRREGLDIDVRKVYGLVAYASNNPMCYKSGYRRWIYDYLWQHKLGTAPSPEEIFTVPLAMGEAV